MRRLYSIQLEQNVYTSVIATYNSAQRQHYAAADDIGNDCGENNDDDADGDDGGDVMTVLGNGR